MFLGLGPSSNALTIGGSSTITGTDCGLMSNNKVKFNGPPTFSGSGWAVDAVSGCVASAGNCDGVSVPHNYNMLPATNPLQVLDTAFNTWGRGQTFAPTPNSPGTCYKGLTVNNGATLKSCPRNIFFL